MTLLLWILAYLAVGFVISVFIYRDYPLDTNFGVLLTVLAWPLAACVLLANKFPVLDSRVSLLGLVRWLSRRLP